MILTLLAAAASAPSPEQMRFEHCTALASQEPAKALDEASRWQLANGGALARQCAGLAYAYQARWAAAAVSFEQAARVFEAEQDGRDAARLWAEAGNAALAGGDAKAARAHLDAALASGRLEGVDAGEAHLDRARAIYALGDATAARADLDAALKLVPADPLAWLLSATAARKSGDLTRAQADIEEAAKRSPDDASVALEAGNIAILTGSDEAARTAWQAAIKLAPEGPAGKAAAEQLARLTSAK
jgi:tetratricopeptide (TPR) repeat protein